MNRQAFHVTVDFPSNASRLGRPMTPGEIDDSIAYFADIGVRRVYWMFYEPSFFPAAVTSGEWHLPLACRLVHARGMECYALIKPFETGIAQVAFPGEDWDCYDPGQAIEGVMGQHPWVTAFVRTHPEMRIQHRNAYEAAQDQTAHRAVLQAKSCSAPRCRPGSPVASIKLVKEDDNATAVTGADLTLYTAAKNSRFAPYPKDVAWRETMEQREGRAVRVLEATGLDIPADRKYILVTCARHSDSPTFVGRADRMLELYDDQGDRIVTTWNEKAPISREKMEFWAHRARIWCRGVYGDRRIPDGYGRDAATGFYIFDIGHRDFERVLDGPANDPAACHIAVVRGRNSHLIGALHPCYPEVRAYWLGMVARAVAAGVDGVDFRIANHSSWCSNPMEYGFNPPVKEAFQQRYGVDILTEDFDVQAWRELQTEFYSEFLRQARALLTRQGKKMQLHVNGGFDIKNFRWRHPTMVGGNNALPLCFDWPWRDWLRDGLADAVTIKCLQVLLDDGGMEHARRVCSAAEQAGVPVFMDSWITGQDGNAYWDECTAFVRRTREELSIAGTILYEGYLIAAPDKETGEFRGSEPMRRLVQELG